MLSEIEGQVEGHQDGHGFVRRDDGQLSIYLSPQEMRAVLQTLANPKVIPLTISGPYQVIGVVPLDMELGIELSPEVGAVVGKAVEDVVAVLRGLGCGLGLKSPVGVGCAE